ncbi:MAG: YHS domain-containing (seleno)protein [Geminicoccaceae bacterium]
MFQAVPPWRAVLLAVVLAGIAPLALAGERLNAKPGGVAVKGYDVVAYFTEGQPTPGDEQFVHRWQNVRWLFASAAHRDAFAAEPTRYAPRYGGFCAGAMTRGFRATIDPQAFAIVDGKLYLAYSQDGIERFEADAESNVAVADDNWQRLGITD